MILVKVPKSKTSSLKLSMLKFSKGSILYVRSQELAKEFQTTQIEPSSILATSINLELTIPKQPKCQIMMTML